MFILHKSNNCTQRCLLNLDEQANYAALFFTPIAFSAVTKFRAKIWSFPWGTGFIYSNLCTRAELEDVGSQAALQFPRGDTHEGYLCLCPFSPGVLTCQPQHQPLPDRQGGLNSLLTDTRAQNSTVADSGVILWSSFSPVHLLPAPSRRQWAAWAGRAAEPPLPVLPCSCAAHLALPALGSAVLQVTSSAPLAATARAALEQTFQALCLQGGASIL